jgi:VIT1/CCC1 family predicted Fe2+/Mn2+ transporter
MSVFPLVGASGLVWAVTVHPELLVPVLVTAGVLGAAPLLLFVFLALVAVYSPKRRRRNAAKKILRQVLAALRPSSPD